MVKTIRRSPFATHAWVWLIVPAVLVLSAYLGTQARMRWLALPLIVMGAVALLQRPIWGLFSLIFVALLARFQFGTGTDVLLNPATLLAPAMLLVWILVTLLRRETLLVPSRTNKPLFFFLIMGLLSLLIGNAFWDPGVPRGDNFTLVQLAQWSVFAFSAGVFWLTGSTVRDENWLRRLTFFFLTLAGGLAIILALPGGFAFANRAATYALFRAPFWLLLTALAGGQLLFNRRLTLGWRLFCLLSLAAVLYYAFGLQRERLSNMVGVAVVAYVLVWLRWPRLRVFLLMLPILGVTLFYSELYNYVGGDAKWDESGASRGVLIGRVIEVSLRNPLTGIGPAAYRSYSRMQPLSYQGAYWVDPQVNSHNNYVDLFSQGGLVGL
ncbi:MAG: O-antigen ligase family protein, partial [Anaerolineae bacterium]|nr:O-antigen ligase family protein [Anaerolineae bacterium]